ncbi:MAG: lysine--tRNA ligase [Endomicrobium sp.]|jgi:lysyl-tRNA synthetase class 2|nr:lysine--tRNA ligase [Endomicrobium sp.]
MKNNNYHYTKNINEIINNRKNKINILRNHGINPYPSQYHKQIDILEVQNKFNKLSIGQCSDTIIKICGRIISIRKMGQVMFFDIQDGVSKIQIYVNKSIMGKDKYTLLKKVIDVSDIIAVEGKPFKTKTNELSIIINQWQILTKALRPLPEKWNGLKDIEIRYRQRHIDLIVNRKSKDVFIKRSIALFAIRTKLTELGFIEVETPILQSIAGGASAQPFITHHNALNTNLFLRVSPELFLKRLIIGGMDKVFEIGKSFRNEGIDSTHTPEFTMIEIYQAYANYNDMLNLAETLIQTVAKALNSKTNLKFKKAQIFDLINEYTGLDLLPYIETEGEMFKRVKHLNLKISENATNKKVLEQIIDEKILPNLHAPFFLMDYPSVYSPLAKMKEHNVKIAERFEIYINKLEIGNAYSELNDPEIQKNNFIRQIETKKNKSNNETVSSYDQDFICALEQGLPPTGGLGIGIDRLIMVLTEIQSIRDVILFPTLKPE